MIGGLGAQDLLVALAALAAAGWLVARALRRRRRAAGCDCEGCPGAAGARPAGHARPPVAAPREPAFIPASELFRRR
uniref:FeoB-associated Cys-rich membrane protein n=1 Tax=Eiseniibacteriota bacterium TaxID=2212470 RepID=A0A832I1V1_UNCEI